MRAFLLVGVEAGGGLELEAEGLVWSALLLVEDQQVGADREGDGEAAEDVEGGLGLAALVAAELDHVDAGGLGQGLLGEASFLADCGQALGEVHGKGE